MLADPDVFATLIERAVARWSPAYCIACEVRHADTDGVLCSTCRAADRLWNVAEIMGEA